MARNLALLQAAEEEEEKRERERGKRNS